MKFINRARGSGKTTMLIYSSYTTGYPIIVKDRIREKAVIEQAKSLGLDIRVYSLEEYIRNVYVIGRNKHNINGLLVDEASDIIGIALQNLLGAPVIACTFTIPLTDIDDKESKTNE